MQRISPAYTLLAAPVALILAALLLAGTPEAVGALGLAPSDQEKRAADDDDNELDNNNDDDDKNDDSKNDDDRESAAETPPQRMVLQTGRDEFIYGTVAQETDTIITLDTAEGVKTFIKSRLLRRTKLVDPKPGQRGVVILIDGSRREGVIIADEYERVLLEVAGVRSPIDRRLVDRVELLPSVRERYQLVRDSLQPEQYDRRFDLCRWLVEMGEFRLALKELEALHAEAPRLEAIGPLLRQVRAQVALMGDDDREANIPQHDVMREPRRSGPVDHAEVLPTHLLTREEVNLIRVFEIDFRNPPRVAVDADTIRALITEHASHPSVPASAEARAALFRAEPLDLVRLMFEVRARELYPQIQVLTEPYALNLFQHRVHNTWLIKNCATSRCHGGVEAGPFFLHSRNYRDERVRFTNLLILERMKLEGKPPLVNFDEPTQSLILQHALPITEARYPHPEVPGWRPAIGPGERRMVEDFVNWVRAMYHPRPDYGVDFEPPRLHDPARARESQHDRTDR